jgi:hypothetical protein
MAKRQLMWTGVAASLALAAYLAVWLTTPHLHPVNRDNFERIQLRMTLAEVEAIVEYPPGDYTTGPIFTGPWTMGSIQRWKRWYSDEGEIAVEFDEDGRVQDQYFAEVVKLKEVTIVDRIRGWLGW